MGVIINEFLPNPIGTDSGAEWLELKNTSSESVRLSGWRLENSSGKKFYPGDKNLPAGGLLVFNAPSGFALKNTEGELSLYEPGNILRDKSAFFGSAPEGMSWSRQENGFAFTEPTPGKENLPGSYSVPPIPWGRFGSEAGYWEIAAITICWGLLAAVAAGFISHWFYETKKPLS